MIAGRYSLEREIGRGGMGAVWLGRDEVLGRAVAVKRLGSTIGSNASQIERAEREARLAAHLNHPNVVAVFDLVTEEEVVWLVMEYVAGATLAEVIRTNERLSVEDTAAALGQVAEALSAAHAAGIVHRDVKPSNVLVGDDGSVKISDFGIARADSDSHLTETGLVTGSPAYLAPEVASGGPATAASDVWSLGATAFHALTGEPPYHVGDNLMGALYRIVHEPAPRAEGAGWLAPLIEATMVHDPARRWSMPEVVAFLATAAEPAARPEQSHLGVAGAAPVSSGASDPVHLSAVTSHRPPGPARRRAGVGVAPLLVAAAAVALVVMVGLLLTQGEDTSRDLSSSPGDETTSASPTEPSPDPTATPSPSPTAAEPTAEGIEEFIGDYLQTASRNPGQGFTMLTAGFQAQSPNYVGFWDSVTNPRITNISADPENTSVTYTYRYNVRGQGQRTDTVNLQLVFDDGMYLIDGEA